MSSLDSKKVTIYCDSVTICDRCCKSATVTPTSGKAHPSGGKAQTPTSGKAHPSDGKAHFTCN